MKAIKIIKQKQIEEPNETATKCKKPIEPSTGRIVHTVKNWIAESQERKRNYRRSLSALGLVILIAFAVAMAQSPETAAERTLSPEERAIRVTISTTDGFLGPATQRFKVGDQIPVNITMTNTSTKPLYTCISSDLYQDLQWLSRIRLALRLYSKTFDRITGFFRI